MGSCCILGVEEDFFFHLLCLFWSTRGWSWGISMLGKYSSPELSQPHPHPGSPTKRLLIAGISPSPEKETASDLEPEPKKAKLREGPTGPRIAWQRPWIPILSYAVTWPEFKTQCIRGLAPNLLYYTPSRVKYILLRNLLWESIDLRNLQERPRAQEMLGRWSEA